MIYPVEVNHMQYTRHETAAPTAYPRRQTSTSSTQSAQQSPNFSRPWPQQTTSKKAFSTGALPLANAAPISHQTITITPKPRSSSTSTSSNSHKAHQPTRSKTHRRPKMGTYFLTGANRGIGLELVRQLSANPSNTLICGVRSKATTDLTPLLALAEPHNNIHIVDCDVSSPTSLSGLEFRVAEILSKQRSNLDFVFNVAGINATSHDTSLTLTPESMANHMQTNVLAPAHIVQCLRRYLARGATVLNMTSGLGSLSVAGEVTKCCTYSVSKAALNMLTVHQSKDLKGNGVKVVCVDPGWVKTAMGGEGAVLEPRESVRGILDVVAGLREADSGKFYRYDGEIVPW